MANLFQQAIDRKELQQFALGEGVYRVESSTGTGVGEHWVSGSWQQSVLDLYDDDKSTAAEGVRSMFSSLVGNSPAAAAERVGPLLDHLQQYWINRHDGWIEFELGPVAKPIAQAVAAERERCRRDEGDVDLRAIDMTIKHIQARGGLSELPA